jgi:hypothetical protein
VNGVRSPTRGYPVEEFLQALTAQLDRAQDALEVSDHSPVIFTFRLSKAPLAN